MHKVEQVFQKKMILKTYPITFLVCGAHLIKHVFGQNSLEDPILLPVWFEFSFLSPWLIDIARLKNQSAQLFNPSWRKNRCIHTLPNEMQKVSFRIWTQVMKPFSTPIIIMLWTPPFLKTSDKNKCRILNIHKEVPRVSWKLSH